MPIIECMKDYIYPIVIAADLSDPEAIRKVNDFMPKLTEVLRLRKFDYLEISFKISIIGLCSAPRLLLPDYTDVGLVDWKECSAAEGEINWRSFSELLAGQLQEDKMVEAPSWLCRPTIVYVLGSRLLHGGDLDRDDYFDCENPWYKKAQKTVFLTDSVVDPENKDAFGKLLPLTDSYESIAAGDDLSGEFFNPTYIEEDVIPEKHQYNVTLPNKDLCISYAESFVVHRCELGRCEPEHAEDEMLRLESRDDGLYVTKLSSLITNIVTELGPGESITLGADAVEDILISGDYVVSIRYSKDRKNIVIDYSGFSKCEISLPCPESPMKIGSKARISFFEPEFMNLLFSITVTRTVPEMIFVDNEWC